MEPQTPQNQPSSLPETAAPPKRKRGRPRILDETKRAQICLMLSLGCSMGTATQYVSVKLPAVRKAAKRDPVFREQLQKALRTAEVSALRHLHNAAANNWRAAAWLLERTRPQQYGYRSARHLRMDFYHAMHEYTVNYLRELLPDDESREWFVKRMELAQGKERSDPILRDSPFFDHLPRNYPTPITTAQWPDDPPPSVAKYVVGDKQQHDEPGPLPVPPHSTGENGSHSADNVPDNPQSDVPQPRYCAEIPPN